MITKSSFSPVTITLESQKEVDVMWILLNTGKEAAEALNFHGRVYDDYTHTKMFASFNDVTRIMK